MSKIARLEPDEKCTKLLNALEWKVLYMRVNRVTVVPKEAPTNKEAVEMIARLGGYMARKSDPPPGPIVIWRGWRTLNECYRNGKNFPKDRVKMYDICGY